MTLLKSAVRSIVIAIQKFVVARRVPQGTLRLDKTDPQWAQWVNPSLINMNNAFSDVLGQWAGNYSKGLEKLGITGPHKGFIAAKHGFCSDNWAPSYLLEEKWNEAPQRNIRKTHGKTEIMTTRNKRPFDYAQGFFFYCHQCRRGKKRRRSRSSLPKL